MLSQQICRLFLLLTAVNATPSQRHPYNLVCSLTTLNNYLDDKSPEQKTRTYLCYTNMKKVHKNRSLTFIT